MILTVKTPKGRKGLVGEREEENNILIIIIIIIEGGRKEWWEREGERVRVKKREGDWVKRKGGREGILLLPLLP